MTAEFILEGYLERGHLVANALTNSQVERPSLKAAHWLVQAAREVHDGRVTLSIHRHIANRLDPVLLQYCATGVAPAIQGMDSEGVPA